MNIAICFLTTNKNHFNLKLLKDQIKLSSLHNIDVYEYIDNDSEYIIDDHIIYFNYDFLVKKTKYNRAEINYIHPALGKKVGLEFLTFIDMYINHKNEYDFYMFYEDDVSYFGSKNLFDIIDFNCDAIFQDRRFNAKEDGWYWTSCEPYNLNDINIIYHGLLNIYGLTGNIINEIINYYSQGNYCHHEGLISSYVLNNGKYKVNYINDYIKSYFDFWDSVEVNGYYDLIHPIKTEEKYNIIYNEHHKN
jgi:hypothetical protein